jgi:hypothetical protein
VPVYDARSSVVDFNTDLGRLDEVLPLFDEEIPFGSFVVVGYTVSVYRASLTAGGERVPQLGCNLVWAIVCRTPDAKGKSSGAAPAGFHRHANADVAMGVATSIPEITSGISTYSNK